MMWKQSYSDGRRAGVGVFSKAMGGLRGGCTEDAIFELGLGRGLRAHTAIGGQGEGAVVAQGKSVWQVGIARVKGCG